MNAIESKPQSPTLDEDIHMDMDIGTWMKILGWLAIISGVIAAIMAMKKEEGSTVGLWIAAFSSIPWASIFFVLAVLLDRSKEMLRVLTPPSVNKADSHALPTNPENIKIPGLVPPPRWEISTPAD